MERAMGLIGCNTLTLNASTMQAALEMYLCATLAPGCAVVVKNIKFNGGDGTWDVRVETPAPDAAKDPS
jgi:hypothetical protein